MSKLTIFLSIVIVYFCCIAIGYGDSTSGPSAGSGVAPKKVRVLSPSASRLYRLLRNGVKLNQIGDEDLLTEEDLFLQKRQYDDYGHMRFGKRTGNDFDDYGHLRFGK